MNQDEIYKLAVQAQYAVRCVLSAQAERLYGRQWEISVDELDCFEEEYTGAVDAFYVLSDLIMQLDTKRPCLNIVGKICRGIHNCDTPCYKPDSAVEIESRFGGNITLRLIDQIKKRLQGGDSCGEEGRESGEPKSCSNQE